MNISTSVAALNLSIEDRKKKVSGWREKHPEMLPIMLVRVDNPKVQVIEIPRFKYQITLIRFLLTKTLTIQEWK